MGWKKKKKKKEIAQQGKGHSPVRRFREAEELSDVSTRPNKLVRVTGETGRSSMNDARGGVSRKTSFQRAGRGVVRREEWEKWWKKKKKERGRKSRTTVLRGEKNNVAIFLYRKSSDRDVLEWASWASRGRVNGKTGSIMWKRPTFRRSL